MKKSLVKIREADISNINERIEKNVLAYLENDGKKNIIRKPQFCMECGFLI
jgi:hypothetical protein